MIARAADRASHAPWQPLLEAYGVLPSYRDVHGQRRLPNEAAALGVLRALGAPVWSADDVPAALQAWQRAWWQQAGEPVQVLWQGTRPPGYALRLRQAEAGTTIGCEIALEEGPVRRWSVRARLPLFGRRTVLAGQRYGLASLALPADLPLGYHRLRLAWGERHHEALLIVAPPQAYTTTERAWGLFAPLYALRRAEDWGIGDWTSWAALNRWTTGQGGRVVGTLPMLAAFLDRPFEPSPYAPASRLAWNEIFLDVTALPEFTASPAAQQLAGSPAFQQEVSALRAAAHVDYARVMALKRRVLVLLARHVAVQGPPPRQGLLEAFLRAHPHVEGYARYRAAMARYGTPWSRWPQPLREGTITPADVDASELHYHRYVQWACDQQLTQARTGAQQTGTRFYLDLPLGVHRESYDVWRERDAFLLGCSGGAPPDLIFTTGQDWGFPPPHPEGMRRQQYRYFRACVRHHLQHAGALRLDHVMSLYRLFVIPHGLPSQEGVYVRYPAKELAAILCVESQRHQALLVGENLGLVPPEVTALMHRHRFHGLYIGQFELAARPHALRAPAAEMVASLNTHDLHPFAASWHGRDLADRVAAGQLAAEALPAERARREQVKAAFVAFLRRQGLLTDPAPEAGTVLRAALQWLARSPAALLLVNLEDLWLEEQAQNMPGTWHEQPNWQRKCRFTLEEVRHNPAWSSLLTALTRDSAGELP